MSEFGLENAEGAHNAFMAFRVATQEFCIDIGAVREVRRTASVARLPRAPSYVSGVINLRGVILPVVDMRERLGLQDACPDQSEIVTIIAVGEKLLGLL